MISPLLNLLNRARKPRSAAVVRSVAGLPIGAGNRRGTVLVLVIGALALISVITLIYATIGQSDRRKAAVTQVHADAQTAANVGADYVAMQVADGAFSVMVSGDYMSGTRDRPVLVRPAADYPATDPFRRSVCPVGSPVADRGFDPTGSYDKLLSPATTLDRRIPSTPFLAATQPVWLGSPGPNTQPDVQDERDWLHITNLAPDGRFVNLYNLAPTVLIAGQAVRASGFGAISTMPVSGAAGVGNPAAPSVGSGSVVSNMNWGKTLFDNLGNPTLTLDFAGGGQADPNTPAHWDSRQQWMFRPAGGPMFVWNNASADPIGTVPASLGISANSPGSVYYAPYQYCDTDGDGFFDARWFELVDATDPSNPVSYMPKDDRFRWFMAARVIDLSSMVNVNTATDFLAPTAVPLAHVTLFGAYPSDVDLRRLLSMDDLYRQYSQNAANGPQFGYAGLEQPPAGLDNYLGYDMAAARQVGDRAYRALRQALRQSSESVLPANANLAAFPVPDLWRDDRYTYYTGFGGQAEAGYSLLVGSNAQVYDRSARFTAADLKELLTVWATNYAGSTSRLEQTLDGRGGPPNGPATATGFGPLRSNRANATERGGIDNQLDPAGSPLPMGDGRPDKDAMIRSVFDVRHYITPLSWSRPLRSTVIPKTDTVSGLSYQNLLDSSVDLKTDAIGGLVAATRLVAAEQDPSKLFKGYGQSLLPYSWVRSQVGTLASAWDPASRLATLNFGANAELALRTAAFMTANLIDSYDKDNVPHGYTVLIDEDRRTQIASAMYSSGPYAGDTQFPWWNVVGNTPTTFPGRLDLNLNTPNNGRLARTTSGSPVDPVPAAALGAVNVYGTEAQPFVSQVVSFFVYTDAPTTATPAGDDEFATGETQITMDGTVGGSDDLGQIIAFQLTNPFNVDIDLTQVGGDPLTPITDNEYSDFYIQFGGTPGSGGNLYKLAKYRETSGEITPVVLHKGETKVFYCLSDQLAAMETKWNAAHGMGPGLPTNPVQKFVDNQLGITQTAGVTYITAPGPNQETLDDGRVKPIRIRQMSQLSGATQATPNHNFFDAGSAGPNTHVLVWRTIHTPALDPGGAVGSGAINKRSNDMLVDHLRDPGPAGSPGVSTLDRRLPVSNQSIAGTTADPEGNGDNRGFSIVMWGQVRRTTDPAVAAGSPPLGAIPSYCVEAKWGTSLNQTDRVPVTPGSLSRGDFTGGAPAPLHGDETLRALVSKLATLTPTPPPDLTKILIPDITKQPKDWPVGVGAMPSNQDPTPRAYRDLYPVIHLNNNKFEARINPAGPTPLISTMRLADLLLPMGIGPMTDPDPTLTNPTDPSDPAYGSLALSEALGLALNYSSPPAANTPGWGLYYKVGDSLTGCLDRGNLALDRSAPYEDATASGPVHVFDPGGQDKIRWPGIPLALNVLNMFTVNEPQFGGMTQAMHGLININTAPRAVLYTIPFLSPTTDPGVSTPEWTIWKTASGVTAAYSVPEDPSGVGALDGTDVASGILAYRERQLTNDRDGHPINFTDAVGTSPFGLPYTRDGRTQTSRIPAHREVAGFATPGEILTIVDHGPAANTRIIAPGDQIDSLARDGLPSGVIGMNTTVFKDSAGTTKVDEVTNDYAEKLLIAQGALDSITVRSDLFAVWFVVQGYQKSDTEGLGLTDLLKPSVSKRYLMVVDRSNVTRKGEKPRIVFLTEVPM